MKKIILLLALLATVHVAFSQPTISFTFDDGVTQDMPGYPFKKWNGMILDHLASENVKAIFFVTGANKLDDKGKFLLSSWNDNGHRIANHTYSHYNFANKIITLDKYRIEFQRTDSIIKTYSNFIPLFRFPYLKEGDTREKVDGFRKVLAMHGYKNGAVTIDASDWYIDSRLIKRLRTDPNADISGFRKFYLDHIFERAQYYEKLSYALTGRHIKHTLLLHHNLTSALFLGDLIQMFRSKGWQVIDASEAYGDPIFNTQPSILPAGESLIWSMAKESKRFENELRYPAEDSQYESAKMDLLGL